MVISTDSKTRLGSSLKSLIQGFLLTQRSDCKSPRTIEYYQGNLERFIWYVEKESWSDDIHLITEWEIREFLEYVINVKERWGRKGNGSESSRNKAKYSTVHHYYRVLKTFFSWCVSEELLKENPMQKIKFKKIKMQ